LLFYIWGEGELLVLVILSALFNYLIGLGLAYSRIPKSMLIIGILLNIGLLGYYKYYEFIIENLNVLGFNIVHQNSIILPIGISFFTFHGLSYIIDVYRDKKLVQKNVSNLLLYITFFPQLVAGPIVRYHDISQQLNKREVSVDKMTEGIKRFIIGLAKKVLIANTLGALATQIFSTDTSLIGTGPVWLAIIAYSFQIYYDFSGYSDMAIGLAKFFGFDFPENFNFPYISKSVKEFWQRWHLSLSNWFKDYLYIPLGGSKNGNFKTYRNLMIVFLCTGIWHGASWNFIVWGCTHGILIIIERLFLLKYLEKSSIISRIYLMTAIVTTWLFFTIEDFSKIIIYLKKMYFISGTSGILHLNVFMSLETVTILVLAIIFSVPWHRIIIIKTPKTVTIANYLNTIFLLVLFLLCISNLASETYNPFIYFRF
jgi:alginate O-acetyltransferase complex protein AlgI